MEHIVPFLSALLDGQINSLKGIDWNPEPTSILLTTFKIFNVALSTGIPVCLNNPELLAKWMAAIRDVLLKRLPERLAAPATAWDIIFERESELPVKLQRVGIQIASS